MNSGLKPQLFRIAFFFPPRKNLKPTAADQNLLPSLFCHFKQQQRCSRKSWGVALYSACIKHILHQTSNSSNEVSSAAVRHSLMWGGVMIQRGWGECCWWWLWWWWWGCVCVGGVQALQAWTHLPITFSDMYLSSTKSNANWQCTPASSVVSFLTNFGVHSSSLLALLPVRIDTSGHYFSSVLFRLSACGPERRKPANADEHGHKSKQLSNDQLVYAGNQCAQFAVPLHWSICYFF